MLILKNWKELLEHFKSPNFNHITSITSFDFSYLYITIPHGKLKSRLSRIIRNSFIVKTVTTDTNIWDWVTKVNILWRNTLFPKASTLKTTSSRSLRFFGSCCREGFPAESRHSNWGKNCALADIFCTHTKRNSYSLCSRRERSN